MKRYIAIFMAAGLVGIAAGCSQTSLNEGLAPGRGSTRALGDTSYQQAFAAAREVMGQYFTVASANANSGIIKSHPKRIEAQRERLLGGSPARQTATMHVCQEGGRVVAQVVVIQQRQGSSARKRMGYSTERRNYSGNPGEESPADIDAATTAKQNEAWATTKESMPDVETKILSDLHKRLHGGK